jgi:hypothetical protein
LDYLASVLTGNAITFIRSYDDCLTRTLQWHEGKDVIALSVENTQPYSIGGGVAYYWGSEEPLIDQMITTRETCRGDLAASRIEEDYAG